LAIGDFRELAEEYFYNLCTRRNISRKVVGLPDPDMAPLKNLLSVYSRGDERLIPGTEMPKCCGENNDFR
jgi:hypothetical protein